MQPETVMTEREKVFRAKVSREHAIVSRSHVKSPFRGSVTSYLH